MTAPHRKRSEKTGLPPGSLVHIGKRFADKTTMTILDYGEAGYEEREVTSVSDCGQLQDEQTVRWITVEGIHDTRALEQIGVFFGLHALTLEDILNTSQRPKMEDFGQYIYIVLKMLAPHGTPPAAPSSEQISIVLGKNFVLSFQERRSDAFTSLRERIKNGKGRMTAMGADYLAYAIVDTVVDNYFAILEDKEESMDSLEEELIRRPTPATMHAIQRLKRNFIELRKAVWPLRETVSNLERSESGLISKATRLYLRDVYDHTIQVIDTVETFRDMLSGMLDIYLSSISNKMNEIMKMLTVIATIFIPLTFIVGVYGMNFKYMPELELRWGYHVLWGVMIAIALLMLLFFRRKKWL